MYLWWLEASQESNYLGIYHMDKERGSGQKYLKKPTFKQVEEDSLLKNIMEEAFFGSFLLKQLPVPEGLTLLALQFNSKWLYHLTCLDFIRHVICC